MKKLLVLLCVITCSAALPAHSLEQTTAYARALPLDWSEALRDMSAYFTSTPYSFVVDQFYDFDRTGFDPRAVRTDAFDCMSYVEMVLALCVARQRSAADCSGALDAWWQKDPNGLLHTELARIMFAPASVPKQGPGLQPDNTEYFGHASVVTRHRFIDAEWLRGNKWLVENITQNIFPTAPYTAKQLTKKELIMRQVAAHAKTLPEQDGHELIAFYTKQLDDVGMQTALTHYLPVDLILQNKQAFTQMLRNPHIITIVSEHPDLRAQVGSHYNVTHLGFGITVDNQLLFRHATYQGSVGPAPASFFERVQQNSPNEQSKVVDVDLCEYLQKRVAKNSWRQRVLGIQVLRIRHPNEWRLLQ